MSQLSLGQDQSTKRTRKREFLDELRRVVPWLKLIALIEPHYPAGKTGRPPFPIATVLQIHFMHVCDWTKSFAALPMTHSKMAANDPATTR